jgi:2-iminobutanoate/2-iminopropanoate deaminase
MRDSKLDSTFHMMTHDVIEVPGAPKPLGPYSAAIALANLVFVSGQGARDPLTNQLAGADIETQTSQCLKNVRGILRAAGSDLQHVLKCTVFLTDMADFKAMNAVYATAFGDHQPARTTVQAAALPTPGLRVEIDCIAYRP